MFTQRQIDQVRHLSKNAKTGVFLLFPSKGPTTNPMNVLYVQPTSTHIRSKSAQNILSKHRMTTIKINVQFVWSILTHQRSYTTTDLSANTSQSLVTDTGVWTALSATVIVWYWPTTNSTMSIPTKYISATSVDWLLRKLTLINVIVEFILLNSLTLIL